MAVCPSVHGVERSSPLSGERSCGSRRHAEHARTVEWRCLSLLQCLMFAVACAACSAVVYTKQPAGDEPVKLDRSLWEGIWVPQYEGAGAGRNFDRRLVRPIYIRVADADKGKLRVSWVEERGGDFKLVESDVYVRRQGHWLLVSLPWPGGDGYWWARLEVYPSEQGQSDKGSLVVWAPSASALAKPIRDRIVPGRIVNEGLFEIDQEGIAWMQSGDDSTGSLWKAPTLYQRITLDSFEPPIQSGPPVQKPPLSSPIR